MSSSQVENRRSLVRDIVPAIHVVGPHTGVTDVGNSFLAAYDHVHVRASRDHGQAVIHLNAFIWPLDLSGTGTSRLRIAHSRSERVDQVRRATALLAAARSGVFIHAAREAGLRSGTTVADLVARFNRIGLEAVCVAPGRGRKPSYALSARAQIVATAQRAPAASLTC